MVPFQDNFGRVSMNSGKNVFRQLLQFLPRHDFNLCVRRYRGEHWVKTFTTFDQFLCLAYAQLSGRESLRDIETCLNSHRDKLYHVGFRGAVSRTTLAVELKHLRIKSFYGSSVDAVKSRIWVGLCIYLLMAIAKKRLGIQCSLYTFLQILEHNLFEKKPIILMASEALKQTTETPYARNQLKLFGN